MKIPMKLLIHNKLTPTRIIVLGFLLLILTGTLLLLLPVCHNGKQNINFLDALFTATSSVCVTGLIVKDTATTWSFTGQLILLILIQIGGLGIMSIFTLFAFITKKQINLKERLTIQESIGNFTLSETVKVFLKILVVTVIFESLGALILFPQFKSIFGLKNGVWKSIFHSVSAFCNAGFDILGNKNNQFQSFTALSNNPTILYTIGSLIIIGGLGFIVWKDISTYKFNFRRYSLHSKIVLLSTFILIVGSTIAFYLFELSNPHTLLYMNNENKLANAFFQAITPRTAGFNSINVANMTNSSLFLTILLMVIGGAPGSTAGGIKVTTLSILVLSAIFFTMGRQEIQIMRNNIPRNIIFKSVCIFMLALLLIFTSVFVLMINEPEISFIDACFESASAFGTVGLSTGITPSLSSTSKVVLMFLMFLGRIGPLTAVIAFSQKQLIHKSTYRYSDGKISVG